LQDKFCKALPHNFFNIDEPKMNGKETINFSTK